MHVEMLGKRRITNKKIIPIVIYIPWILISFCFANTFVEISVIWALSSASIIFFTSLDHLIVSLMGNWLATSKFLDAASDNLLWGRRLPDRTQIFANSDQCPFLFKYLPRVRGSEQRTYQ